MIVHDSAISICYAMLRTPLLWLLWLRLWLWRGAMRERDMAAVRCEHVRL